MSKELENIKINSKDTLRIKELIQLIAKYDKQYYELGESEISDAEYDRLYDEYLSFEKKYPELKELGNSPTKRVGAGSEAGTTTGLPKFTHKSPLLSIDRKAKELSELYDFYLKCGGDGVEVIVEPKLDGITCNINYENGKLANAATRGDGYVGDLITENFKSSDTLYPKSISDNASIEIRGEAIIPFDFFKANLMKSDENSEGYSNPRNAVAGIMRQLDPSEVKGKCIHVMFYDFGQTENVFLEDSDDNNVDFIKTLGFDSVPVLKASNWEELKSIVESKMNGMIQSIDGFNVLTAPEDEKHNLSYPQAVCDGLVIKVNSRKQREEIGMSEKGPKWAFAYKFKPLQAKTRIHHVEWQVGKSGRISPVAVFDEISLGGTKITRATLNNYDYMKTLPVLTESRAVYVPNCRMWPQTRTLTNDTPVPVFAFIREGDVLLDLKPELSQGGMKYIKVAKIASDGFWIKDIENEDHIYDDEWYPWDHERYCLQPEPGLWMDDTIIVERSNDVIPRIVAIVGHVEVRNCETEEEKEKRRETFNVPKVCPVCGHAIQEKYPLHYCTNPLCSAQVKGKIEHYASREAMNIIGLGKGIVDVLCDEGLIKDLPDIYNLHTKKDELLKLEKFGTKKVENLLKSIESSKTPELWQFIYSLSIPNVGKRASKDLTQRFHTLNNILKATKEDLLSMESIGDIMSDTILEYTSNEDFVNMIHKLLNAGVQPKEVELNGDKFKGMSFVITGTLKEPRNYYQSLIEKNGGKVSGSVSKKTNVVLIGTDAGSKEAKARDLVFKGANIILLDTQEKVDKYFEEVQ